MTEENKDEHDFWNDLLDAVKEDVEDALKQSENGEGITYDEFIKNCFPEKSSTKNLEK